MGSKEGAEDIVIFFYTCEGQATNVNVITALFSSEATHIS